MDTMAYVPAPNRHRTPRPTIASATVLATTIIAVVLFWLVLMPAIRTTTTTTMGSMAPDVLATVATDMQRCTASGWQCHTEWNGDTTGWDTIATNPLPPCPTEDSTGPCHWDATTHNGNGQSFTRTSDGTTVYQ